MGDLTALANERFSAMSHFEIVKKNGSSGYLFFYNPGILPCKVVHKSETVLFVCFFIFQEDQSLFTSTCTSSILEKFLLPTW